MAQQSIDTRIYSWSDCEIRLAGNLLIGVTGVRWKPTQEKEFIYGKGNDPIAIKRGNKSLEGSVTILQNELERLLDQFPIDQNTAQDIPAFGIEVVFTNEALEMVSYQLSGCEFTESPYEMSQNAKKMEIEIPFLALDVKRVS